MKKLMESAKILFLTFIIFLHVFNINVTGLRFLRVIYMINLAEILQFLNVLHAG